MSAIDRTIPNISDAAEFDWREDAAIVVREQPAIAVYLNNYGQVTLRREQSWDEDEDCFIPIARENVLTVVRAILIAAGMEDLQLYRACRMGGEDIDWPEGPYSRQEAALMAMRPDLDVAKAIEDFNQSRAAGSGEIGEAPTCGSKPKDPTAAERQRRHRANKPKRDNRDSHGVTTVTVAPSDRDTVTEEEFQPRLIAAE